MNKDIKIYVVTHKPFNNDFLKSLNIYKTIKVGNNKNLVWCFSDDKNDNIAEKNSNFCELTALYWFGKIPIVILLEYVIIEDILQITI